jgi:hypothetical protein
VIFNRSQATASFCPPMNVKRLRPRFCRKRANGCESIQSIRRFGCMASIRWNIGVNNSCACSFRMTYFHCAALPWIDPQRKCDLPALGRALTLGDEEE